MADPKIKLKRSSVPGKIPTESQVPLGEVALNTFDAKLYASKNVGIGTTVFVVNPWSVGPGTNTYNTYFNEGNVGISKTVPTSKLDVVGDGNFTGVLTAYSFRGDGSQLTGITATSSSGIQINKNNTTVGTAITTVNFTGSGISTVTAASGIATVTIPGTSKSITYATATAGQTSFSATYSVGFVDVFMNGVKLSDSSYAATTGTTIVLNEGASLGDVLEIVGYVITTPTYNITISTSSPSGGANGDIWIQYSP